MAETPDLLQSGDPFAADTAREMENMIMIYPIDRGKNEAAERIGQGGRLQPRKQTKAVMLRLFVVRKR
jgi:hypothetical protein